MEGTSVLKRFSKDECIAMQEIPPCHKLTACYQWKLCEAYTQDCDMIGKTKEKE